MVRLNNRSFYQHIIHLSIFQSIYNKKEEVGTGALRNIVSKNRSFYEIIIHPSYLFISIYYRKVLSAGAAAIRNIVSRNRSLCQPFIDLGIEEVLNDALAKHGAEVFSICFFNFKDSFLMVSAIFSDIWMDRLTDR